MMKTGPNTFNSCFAATLVVKIKVADMGPAALATSTLRDYVYRRR